MTYLLLLLLPFKLFAADVFDLTEEDLNPETEEILIKKSEKHLRNESMIYDFNTNLVIKDQRRFTGADRHRVAVGGLLNGNYEQLTDILGGEISYMHRSTRYNQIWYGAHFFQQKANFDAITQNRTSNTNSNGEGAFQRSSGVKDNVTALGLGVGHRFKLLLDFWQTEDVFENIDVFINAIQLNESFINKQYSGYGLTTNYGIHKRSSNSFFYGAKLSYNIATVARSRLGTESKSDRSLTLGWLALGLEIGLFY
jgi:hypothetical protein